MPKCKTSTIEYTEPKLSTYGDNLVKQWFIYFTVVNPETNEKKRFQFRGDINMFSSKKERYKEASAFIAEWKLKLASGWSPFKQSIRSINRMNLPEALDFALAKMKVSKSTRATYRTANKFVKQSAEHLGYAHLPVSSVTRQHLRLIFEDIQIRLKMWNVGKTHNKNLGAIKKAFTTLLEWEIINTSPAAGLKDMPEVETNKFIPFTEAEKKKIREYLYLNHYRYFTLLMVIYATGIRPKEVLALKIKDIDLEVGSISIYPNFEAENSKTKNIRIVPINNHLMPFFREMNLHNYEPSCFLFGSPYPAGKGNRGGNCLEGKGALHMDYFKPSHTQIKRDTITKLWNKLVIQKLGIKKHQYAMKHTGANEKILAGIDLDALRELYGHSSKLMTEKYARVVKEVYRKQIMEKSPEF